jgi:hypothetical protein
MEAHDIQWKSNTCSATRPQIQVLQNTLMEILKLYANLQIQPSSHLIEAANSQISSLQYSTIQSPCLWSTGLRFHQAFFQIQSSCHRVLALLQRREPVNYASPLLNLSWKGEERWSHMCKKRRRKTHTHTQQQINNFEKPTRGNPWAALVESIPVGVNVGPGGGCEHIYIYIYIYIYINIPQAKTSVKVGVLTCVL